MSMSNTTKRVKEIRSELTKVLTYCEAQYMLIYGNTPLMRPILA